MELLPRDVIFEISQYLFHYDIYNLKLALPNLNLTRETYLLTRMRTINFLYLCRGKYLWQIFRNLYDSIYKDDIFEIKKHENDYILAKVNSSVIADLLRISKIEQLNIFSLTGMVYHNYNIIFKNKAELVDKIFNQQNAIKINHLEQLCGLFKSKACKKLVRNNLEKLNLLDINSYLIKFECTGHYRMMISVDSLIVIYRYLTVDQKKVLIKSLNSFLHHPENKEHYISDQLRLFKQKIGCQ